MAFRDALKGLQADYGANCETCWHAHRPGKRGYCAVFALRVWPHMCCPDWSPLTDPNEGVPT